MRIPEETKRILSKMPVRDRTEQEIYSVIHINIQPLSWPLPWYRFGNTHQYATLYWPLPWYRFGNTHQYAPLSWPLPRYRYSDINIQPSLSPCLGIDTVTSLCSPLLAPASVPIQWPQRVGRTSETGFKITYFIRR